MQTARDSRPLSSSMKDGRKPAWNQNRPHRPSSLRRTTSASLPRSQRVASLVDLLPSDYNDKDGENECDQPVVDNEAMTSSRPDTVSTNTFSNDDGNSLSSQHHDAGLGINLHIDQRLEKVDEWLEKENEQTGSPSPNTRVSKTRGPRTQSSRRIPSNLQTVTEVEMMPSPLSTPKRQPTTPGGGKRAYPEPEPKVEDVGKRPEQLIDELLDGLYRGQANSLSRSKSNEVEDVVEQDNDRTPTKSCQGLDRLSVPSGQGAADYTPTRRASNRIPSLSQNQQTTTFTSSPIRTDPFRPSPLRVSRKPVGSSSIEASELPAFEPTNYKSFPILPIKDGPAPPDPAPYAYAHRIYSKPETVDPLIVRYQHQRGNSVARPVLYFFNDERESIEQTVLAKKIACKSHSLHCIECIEKEYAYLEIKIMPTTLTPEERAKVLAGNRSLRTIKTELENLIENGLISDDAYNTIMEKLPNEGSFNSKSSAGAPTSSFQALSVNEPPPAYQTPSAPSLPTRQSTAPTTRPEISRAVALYPYSEPDDCTFIVGDEIAVYEHMNKDWWMGRNIRTGKEGVFPVNYVTQKAGGPSPGPYGNEKAQSYGGYHGEQQQYQQGQQYPQHQGPPPPGPSNPYNSSVPPVAVANEPSKGQEMGKKFGKKLGNAAIFGAGATIGGKIVNGIF